MQGNTPGGNLSEMIPKSTLFAQPTATTGHDMTSAIYNALIPRQTTPPTTIRDPYLAFTEVGFEYASQSKGVADYLSRLNILNVSTVDNTTYWNAIQTAKDHYPASLFFTDRIAQLDWRYYEPIPPSSKFSDIFYSCNVKTQHFGTTSQSLGLECLPTETYLSPSGFGSVTVTSVASTVDNTLPSPATIIVQNGAKTTPAPNSTRSAVTSSCKS